MACQVLKAVATALAAAGAAASTGGDEISLVQRDVRSVDNTQVNQGVVSAFAALLSAMQLDGAVREGLGYDLEPSPNAQCTLEDRRNAVVKMSKLAEGAEKSPMEMGIKVLSELQDCKNVMYGGSPNPAHLGPCIGAFLGVSKPCSDCGRAYVTNMVSVPGCTKQCLPMMLKCGNFKTEGFTASCMRTTSECMKCGHTYYREYSKCVAGSPSMDETVAMMDKIYDGVATGNTNIVDAVSEAIEAATKRSKKIQAIRAAIDTKKKLDDLDRQEAELMKEEKQLMEQKATAVQ